MSQDAGILNQVQNLFLCQKDRNGKYTWCSENMAEVLGLDSPKQIRGKSDYDLIWKEQADLYITRDQHIFKGYHQNNKLEPQRQQDGMASILVTKNPIYNKQHEIVGIVGFFTDVTDKYSKISNVRLLQNGKLALGDYFSRAILSRQEHAILKHILMGHNPAKIQSEMKISRGAYNSVYDRIKTKMSCETKGDIIMAAIKSGLTYQLL